MRKEHDCQGKTAEKGLTASRRKEAARKDYQLKTPQKKNLTARI